MPWGRRAGAQGRRGAGAAGSEAAVSSHHVQEPGLGYTARPGRDRPRRPASPPRLLVGTKPRAVRHSRNVPARPPCSPWRPAAPGEGQRAQETSAAPVRAQAPPEWTPRAQRCPLCGRPPDASPLRGLNGGGALTAGRYRGSGRQPLGRPPASSRTHGATPGVCRAREN